MEFPWVSQPPSGHAHPGLKLDVSLGQLGGLPVLLQVVLALEMRCEGPRVPTRAWEPFLLTPLGLPPLPLMRVSQVESLAGGGYSVGAGMWISTAAQRWGICAGTFHEPQSRGAQDPPHKEVRMWGLRILAQGKYSFPDP